MSQFLGALDARMPQFQTSLHDETWIVRSGRRDFSHRRRGESQYGSRGRYWTLWASSAFMTGGESGYCPMNQDSGARGGYSPPQRSMRGNGSLKFIMGTCKDADGNALGGAVVRGYLSSTGAFVRETACDDHGNYELGTEYPATNHYLTAYYDTATDLAGTTVNTLQPTNRDGT